MDGNARAVQEPFPINTHNEHIPKSACVECSECVSVTGRKRIRSHIIEYKHRRRARHNSIVCKHSLPLRDGLWRRRLCKSWNTDEALSSSALLCILYVCYVCAYVETTDRQTTALTHRAYTHTHTHKRLHADHIESVRHSPHQQTAVQAATSTTSTTTTTTTTKPPNGQSHMSASALTRGGKLSNRHADIMYEIVYTHTLYSRERAHTMRRRSSHT